MICSSVDSQSTCTGIHTVSVHLYYNCCFWGGSTQNQVKSSQSLNAFIYLVDRSEDYILFRVSHFGIHRNICYLREDKPNI